MVKHLEALPLQLHQESCFVSHDSISGRWPPNHRLIKKGHLLKDGSSHPEVWSEGTSGRLIKSLSVRIVMTREAPAHDPIWHRPFRLLVVWKYWFYLSTKDGNSWRFCYRGDDFLQPIPSWRDIIVCKDNNIFQPALS